MAKSGTGASLEFMLTQPTVEFTFADGTKSKYQGVCGLTQFQAPFYEKGRFKIGGTLSYRYMEIRNVSIDDTQFAAHTGFGAGLQMSYSILLLGANIHSMTAKDFLTGANATHTNIDYTLNSVYAGLFWQFGSLGLGAVVSSGNATIAPSTFSKNAEAKVQEQLIGARINYNFNMGSGKFFSKLFSK